MDRRRGQSSSEVGARKGGAIVATDYRSGGGGHGDIVRIPGLGSMASAAIRRSHFVVWRWAKSEREGLHYQENGRAGEKSMLGRSVGLESRPRGVGEGRDRRISGGEATRCWRLAAEKDAGRQRSAGVIA